MPREHTNLVPAYYAQYREGHFGARDRIGGVPTHLPSPYPICPECGRPLAFFMQLYVGEFGLFPDDWLALHLYDCTGQGCIGKSIGNRLVALTKGSDTNFAGNGVVYPNVDRVDISWICRGDPDPSAYADDIEPFFDDEALAAKFPHIHDDKLGGCFAWCDDGATTAFRLGVIGQFQNPIPNQCGMIYLYNAPTRGLCFDYF